MPAIKWAKSNKAEDGAEINIWYDSKLHMQKAIDNTKQVLSELCKQENCDNIKLKDIREIKIINDNKFLFTQDMPLYFRIDFLKLIIQAHELIANNKDASIFADLEVGDLKENDQGVVTGERMNKTELFAQEWLDKLEKFGVLTNNANYSSEDIELEEIENNSSENIELENDGLIKENQFIQMINDELSINCLRHVINANLMRAVDVLNMPSADICMMANLLDQESRMAKMHEMPFYSTIIELSKLFVGLKADSIKINTNFLKDGQSNDWTEYNPEVHGYQFMGNKQNSEDESSFDFVDYKVVPPKIYRAADIIDFGVSISDCKGVRPTDTRGGNEHIDVGFTVPKKEDGVFVAKYWQQETISNCSLDAVTKLGEYYNEANLAY